MEPTIGAGSALLRLLLQRIADGSSLDGLLGSDLDAVDTMLRLRSAVAAGATLTWIRSNGPRFDVGLATPDNGRAWRLVFDTDGRTVNSFDLFERPPDFTGIDGGRAVVVNGPSGAGKSTLLQALRDHRPQRPWVVFDEPEHVGWIDTEYLIWRDHVPTLRSGYLAAIAALAGAGNLVATAAAGRSQSEFRAKLGAVPTVWVGLYCGPDELLARERARPDRVGGLAEESFAIHDGWRYDLTFETTGGPAPAEMATAVIAAVERC